MLQRAPPTLLLQSGLHEDAAALERLADACGMTVVRRVRARTALPAGNMAFYGDSFSGPRLVAERHYELLEPTFDLLACLPHEFVRRQISFGPLCALVARHATGFFKPADACAKAFHGTVYDHGAAAALASGRHADAPSLFSEVVAWSVELRLVMHCGRVLSAACYMRDHRRAPEPLQPFAIDPALVAEAVAFAKRLNHDARVDLPPAFVVDVGLIPDRGWAVVEFNPLWCSRFYGAAVPAYFAALADVIFDHGAVPADWRRWSVRAQATGSC